MSDPTGLLENVAERIPVPDDALERLGRRRHSRNRTRRITAAVLALAITIAGGARVWMTFGSAQTQRPITPIVADTYVRFPATADVRQAGSGVLQILIRTNLPDGAMAVVSVGKGTTDTTGPARVSNGVINVTVRNRACRQVGNRLQSEPVHVWLLVAPMMQLPVVCPTSAKNGCVIHQPAFINSALGQRFQNVHGPQVSQGEDGNQISIARTYVFPASTCIPSTPVASIRRLLPFFPKPGLGRYCCDSAGQAAVQYASTVLNWQTPTLESGGCFAGPPSSCPNGPTTQTFSIHGGCLVCRAVAIRVDQVRNGSEMWWGVTQVQGGGLAIHVSAGYEVVAGSRVSVRTTLPAGTRVAVGWRYLDACGQEVGATHVLTVSGYELRFAAATFEWAPACGGVAHRTQGPLAAPTGGFLMAQRVGKASPDDISVVAVRFVPAS